MNFLFSPLVNIGFYSTFYFLDFWLLPEFETLTKDLFNIYIGVISHSFGVSSILNTKCVIFNSRY